MQAGGHLARLDGVMMGRAAYKEPWRLLDVDPLMFGVPAPVGSVREAAEALIPYVEREVAAGVRANAILRHAVGVFQAVPGARAFRRHLAMAAVKPGAGAEVLRAALALVSEPAESEAA
jgi:tRNA-dihydrouridine synthase A